MESIHEKIRKQAHIGAAVLIDTIQDYEKINGDEICETLSRNLMVNNGDVTSQIGEASRILDIDIFDIIDIYFWTVARMALYVVAREQNIEINISKYPNN